MQARQRLTFESEASERLYEYIERNGAVERDELESALSMDAAALDDALESLVEAEHVEERDGGFQVQFAATEERTFEADGDAVTIRPAEQSDFKPLVSVMREVVEEDAYLTAETFVDLLDDEEVIFRNNTRELRICFVATVDDDVVGWAQLRSPNVRKLRHTAELTMGVHDAYRGKGIGSRLLERGLDWADSNGYEKVYQSLPATNQDAVRFLEAQGWETEAIRNAHFKIDDEYVAEQQMAVMLEDPVSG